MRYGVKDEQGYGKAVRDAVDKGTEELVEMQKQK